MGHLLLQLFIIITIYIEISKSKIITCNDPSGCIWYCPANDDCNNIYNCTSIASSCTLQCHSCNAAQIFSSSPTFDILCFSENPMGCPNNMQITTQTSSNIVRLFIISETNNTKDPTPEPSMEPSINPTISAIIAIHQTMTPTPTTITNKLNITNLTNIVIAGNNEEISNNEMQFGSITIFAIILSGIFIICVCIAICFCIDTKRKSKLHKTSTSVASGEYGMVRIEPHQIGKDLEDMTMGHISTTKPIEMRDNTDNIEPINSPFVTPRPPPRRKNNENEQVVIQKKSKKSFNGTKNDQYINVNCELKECDEEDEETDDDDTCDDQEKTPNVVIDINGEEVKKRNSVQNLINRYNEIK